MNVDEGEALVRRVALAELAGEGAARAGERAFVSLVIEDGVHRGYQFDTTVAQAAGLLADYPRLVRRVEA